MCWRVVETVKRPCRAGLCPRKCYGDCASAALLLPLHASSPQACYIATALAVTPVSPFRPLPQTFRDLMAVDKKVLSGKLRLVLLKGPLGSCVVTGDFDPAKLDETLAAFCKH